MPCAGDELRTTLFIVRSILKKASWPCAEDAQLRTPYCDVRNRRADQAERRNHGALLGRTGASARMAGGMPEAPCGERARAANGFVWQKVRLYPAPPWIQGIVCHDGRRLHARQNLAEVDQLGPDPVGRVLVALGGMRVIL